MKTEISHGSKKGCGQVMRGPDRSVSKKKQQTKKAAAVGYITYKEPEI